VAGCPSVSDRSFVAGDRLSPDRVLCDRHPGTDPGIRLGGMASTLRELIKRGSIGAEPQRGPGQRVRVPKPLEG